MAPAHFLRLPLKDVEDGLILVRVSLNPSRTSGRPLDLKLLATDSEEAYALTLHHSKVSQYKDEKSLCSDEEWEACLTSSLLDDQPMRDLDITAQVKVKKAVVIKIRKKVSGHAQILGSLTLSATESARDDLDLFDWVLELLKERTQHVTEVADLKRKHAELEKLVSEETEHFKQLERSKHAFESEHDAWLRDLLNEKKVKIRTQEHILSTARVDESKLAAVKAKAKGSKSEADGSAPKRRGAVGASRKGKRKAETPASPDDETDHGGADKMDIDAKPESLDELSDVDRTTEGPETASDSEPEPEPEAPAYSSTRKKGARAAPRASPPRAAKASKSRGRPPSSNLRNKTPASEDQDDDMPAPRALPFSKKKTTPAPDPTDDESTASE